MNAGEDVEKSTSYTTGGNVNRYSHYREQYGDSVFKNKQTNKKKLGIKLPYDPAIPLLGIYPEKTIIQKDTCTPVFTEALFTIVKGWKKPRCSLTDEWIKRLWYIHMMDYHSAIKRNEFESVGVRWMNLESVTQSEVRAIY